MTDVEVFVDPSCPWAWITSRWVREVAPERGLAVFWRSYCLEIRDDYGVAPTVPEHMRKMALESHAISHQMLRIFEAARAETGEEAVDKLYSEWGSHFFASERPHTTELMALCVAGAGLDARLIEAGNDEKWDSPIRDSMAVAYTFGGPKTQTPTIVVHADPPHGFKGPVMAPAPTGSAALRLWDAVQVLSECEGFFEITGLAPMPPEFTVPTKSGTGTGIAHHTNGELTATGSSPMTLQFYLTCGFQQPGQTMEVAKAAEKLGFHGVGLADHLFYPVEPSTPYPYTASGKPLFALDSPFPDVGVLMGALGAVTSKLHFRTNVYILPLRHPLVAARAIGTAAAMAEGRVELGIGVGHLQDEFDALGVDFHARGRQTDEAIVAVRELLNSGPVSHHGAFWDIGPIYLHPAPVQRVPIFVGGESKAALRRAARLGDGYVSVPHTLDDLESLMNELRRLRAELAPERAPLRFHMHGLDFRTVGDYRSLADMGAEAVTVGFWRQGREPLPLDEQLQTISNFSGSVISKM